MITYQDIYNALRKEKYSEDLQGLPKNFLKEVASYIGGKKDIVEKEHDVFAETIAKTKKQLDNTLTMINELLLRRRKKILSLAFVAAETGISKRDFENMFQHERKLFEEITKKLEEAKKKTEAILENSEDKKFKNQLIRFETNMEEFVDEDGNSLGPFKKGDVANLPLAIVKILIDDKKALSIE